MKKGQNSLDVGSLRQKAEEQLKKKHAEKASPPIVHPSLTKPSRKKQPAQNQLMGNVSESDTLKLLHELEVYQIELVMQNEELKTAVEKAAIATALYDFAPSGYFTLNRNGTIAQSNFSGATMLGTDRSHLANRKFELFITIETRVAFNDFFGKIFVSNSKQICEVQLNRNGNSSRFVHLEGIISDDIQKCLVTAIDITDIKRAQEALIESENRFKQVTDCSYVWIWEVDATGIYTYVSAMEENVLGYEPEEIIGKKHFYDFFPPDIKDELKKAAFEVFSKKESFVNFENPNIHKDGHKVILETSGIPLLDKRGQLLGYRGADREITYRKLAEEQLRKNEVRLRELNATKDKFFSIIAHDLRGPFNSIMGFSNLLTRQIQEKDYDGIAKYAMIIQNSSQRAMNLLINLLEWSRSQTGSMEFSPKTFEIFALIHDVSLFLNDTALQKSITIYVENPRSINVFADQAMIGTILRNLISNAIKFTHQGGNIVISTTQNHDELMITVADNGVGIKKESIEKLFRIDVSYKTTGTKNEQGTGLGLLLCKEFIDKHGGKIWIDSKPGKGSKFYFTIPNG